MMAWIEPDVGFPLVPCYRPVAQPLPGQQLHRRDTRLVIVQPLVDGLARHGQVPLITLVLIVGLSRSISR